MSGPQDQKHIGIPAFPSSFEEVAAQEEQARLKYRPLVQRLSLGELGGLSREVNAELARRREFVVHKLAQDAANKAGR